MTSTDIYTPFTYCLTFLLTGERYYGVRYAKGCHPSQLWTTYFTSSEIITDLIEEHGEDAFIFEVRKTFITAEQARSWETKFLTRIDAAKHPEWLNGHNGGKNFHSTNPETIKKIKDTKANRTPEEKSATSKKRLDTYANRTPEQKAATALKNYETYVNRTPVQKAATGKKISDTLTNKPPEEKAISKQKEIATKANRTPDQKAATSKKLSDIQANRTPDQKAATSKKLSDIQANRTPEEKTESQKKRLDTNKERGVINASKISFLSIIETRKTYAKNKISQCFPEFRQFY